MHLPDVLPRHASSMPMLDGYRAMPRASGNPPLTPPSQRDEEISPLSQQIRQYHPYGVPEPAPRRPSNAYLESGYNPGYHAQAPTAASQKRINFTGLPEEESKLVALLQSPTYPISISPAPAVVPSKTTPTQDQLTHALSGHRIKRPRTYSRSSKPDQHLSPEQEIQRKQADYKQRAAIRSQQRQEQQSQAEAKKAAKLQKRGLSVKAPRIKKSRERKAKDTPGEPVASTEPSSESALPVYASAARYPSDGYSNRYSHQLSQYIPAHHEDPYTPYHSYANTSIISPYATDPRQLYQPIYHPANHQQIYQPAHYPTNPPQLTAPACPPPQQNPDTTLQTITPSYPSYKWTITHFTLSPTQNYPYAQSFLDALTRHTLPSQPHHPYKWHTHTTRGFIASGTQYSLLVLHNAANPFTWEPLPSSTTSIGVYGRFWFTHEEIHWCTFAPDISGVLAVALQQGVLRVKGTWRADGETGEKRFHKAYWCAARMEPLGGLLRRGEGRVDQDPDEVVWDGEGDDGFRVDERDMQTGWDEGVTGVGVEEARRVWEGLLEDAEMWVPEEGWEHVVTGGSEMEEFGW
ncbi:hypothetical protein NX059_000933 [Plenodomus lindquistii]|nr:hypothetical protein NX059_000933 [Plenodomus lindquistii]